MRSLESSPYRALGLIAGALVASGAAALAASEAEVRATPFGVNAHVPDEVLLQKLADADVHWVRADFNWYLIEPQDDAWDWAAFDRLVAEADRLGIAIFPTLGYTPDWANGGQGIAVPPSDPSDWEDFVFQTVSRYSDSIDHWGLWNEPNLEQFFSGTRAQYIEDILKRGSAAVRAADPDAKVLGPELAHLYSADWAGWLARVCDEALGYLDIVTHHVYGDDPDEVFRDLEGPVWPWESTVRGVLTSHGAGEMELWLTETGWHTDAIPESLQAEHYTEMLAGVQARPWLARIFFYEAKDDPNITEKWGILRADLTPKPAYDAYRDHIAANEGLHYRLPAWRLPAYRSIDVDGELADWGEPSGWIELRTADYVALSEPLPGADDLDAAFRARWDAGALYLAIDVTDDVHRQPHTGERIWLGDSVQLAFDADADRTSGGYDADGDYEYGFALTDSGAVVERWVAPDGAAPHAVELAVERSGPRTLYEVRLPWSDLVPAVPGDGVELGFTLLVNDDDGAGREGWLEWTRGVGLGKDPASFATLELRPEATEIRVTATAVDPPLVIAPEGGSLQYRLTLTHEAPVPLAAQVWSSVWLPGNVEVEPLQGPVPVTVDPGEVVDVLAPAVRVPGGATPGFYRLRARVGREPQQTDDVDELLVRKQEP